MQLTAAMVAAIQDLKDGNLPTHSLFVAPEAGVKSVHPLVANALVQKGLAEFANHGNKKTVYLTDKARSLRVIDFDLTRRDL